MSKIRYFPLAGSKILTLLIRRSTGVDQNLKSDRMRSKLSVAIFIVLGNGLMAQKSSVK